EAAAARDLQRSLAIAFVDGLLVAYILAVASAVITTLALSWFWLSSGRHVPSRLLEGRAHRRLSLICISLWLGLSFLEAGAWAWGTWHRRGPRLPELNQSTGDIAETGHATRAVADRETPRLPTRFRDQAPRSSAAPRVIRILVIGESSGRGEPYHPWLSVGQI